MKAYRCEHILEGELGTFKQRVFDTRDLYQAYMGGPMIIRPSNSSRNNLIFSPKHAISYMNFRNIDTYPKI